MWAIILHIMSRFESRCGSEIAFSVNFSPKLGHQIWYQSLIIRLCLSSQCLSDRLAKNNLSVKDLQAQPFFASKSSKSICSNRLVVFACKAFILHLVTRWATHFSFVWVSFQVFLYGSLSFVAGKELLLFVFLRLPSRSVHFTNFSQLLDRISLFSSSHFRPFNLVFWVFLSETSSKKESRLQLNYSWAARGPSFELPN